MQSEVINDVQHRTLRDLAWYVGMEWMWLAMDDELVGSGWSQLTHS
jgi:hypothetical protein